ncbi:MAG: dihydroxyacetone kinase subunit DhaL [Tepidibacter sp.]|jgi:dihydroxyacetone kinase-like protein|uniref:dihydroxyacetone kinase subunit DhaL n=1 Tax=Tepidibacter sp. TaxID=2529387 RepID=UPI0025D0C03F|nr:dihydroxyacetone kinase subunit DhaL [Tepidibacter sp.]MCT4509413.1 dihydroxyacetone kinase subunit DhaL [Tepidibacter sp.]
MNVALWKRMLLKSAYLLKSNIKYLCELDSIAGDGDHGITIGRIGECIEERISNNYENDSIKKINDDLSLKLMNVNGGSAGPLYGTIFEGMSEGIEDKEILIIKDIKNMFKESKEAFQMISKAKLGDKTLVDAFYPAVDAIVDSEGTLLEMLEAGVKASEEGAKNTKNYIAKFGRAKNVGERSIGHKDPGAVSISLFFKGLYEGAK